jgi:hypothetical protein
MLPSAAAEYICSPCGRAYRIDLGYLTPVEHGGS